MLQKLCWIGLAGGLGALSRYGLAGLVQRATGPAFPWGTLIVNAAGCFLFGLVWSITENRITVSGSTRVIVLTGFMGSFTTFSTFAFETSALLRDSEWLLAGGNIIANNLVGVIFLFLGLIVGRVF
jgi:fluoride exporter